MRIVVSLILLALALNAQAQVKKDTIVYNYIYRDTVILIHTKQVKDTTHIDLSNWGIGPYAGIDYSRSRQWGSGVSYTIGFGIAYYVWRLPTLKKKK